MSYTLRHIRVDPGLLSEGLCPSYCTQITEKKPFYFLKVVRIIYHFSFVNIHVFQRFEDEVHNFHVVILCCTMKYPHTLLKIVNVFNLKAVCRFLSIGYFLKNFICPLNKLFMVQAILDVLFIVTSTC